MAEGLPKFSEDDLRLLRELIHRERSQPSNPINQTPSGDMFNGVNDYPAPDIYLAKPVSGSIPPIMPPGPTVTPYYYAPGSALCNIYRLIPEFYGAMGISGKPALVDTGLIHRVFSVKDSPILNNNFTAVVKLKSGQWLAIDQANGFVKLKSVEKNRVLGPMSSTTGVYQEGSCCIVLSDGTILTDTVYTMNLEGCNGLVFPLSISEELSGSSSITDLSPGKVCYGIYDGTKFRVACGGITMFRAVTLGSGTASPVAFDGANAVGFATDCGEVIPAGITVVLGLVDGSFIDVFARCCS